MPGMFKDTISSRRRSFIVWAMVLAALTLSGGEVTEKFYRLAIRGIRGGDIVQLAEFSLYAADGSRVNGGGSTSLVIRDPASGEPLMLNHHAGNYMREVAVNFGITFKRKDQQ